MKSPPHVFSRWRQRGHRRFPNFSTRQTVWPGRLLVLLLALLAPLALLHSLELGHSHWNHWVTSGQAAQCSVLASDGGARLTRQDTEPCTELHCTAVHYAPHCTALHPPKQEGELVEAWCNSYGRAGPGGPGVTGHICLFRS